MKRRTERERFFRHALRHQARRHPTTMTDAEMDAMTSSVLIARGYRRCRCDRWWQDARLDVEARDLGVIIVRAGEAALDVCPRCALVAQRSKSERHTLRASDVRAREGILSIW
jgi:hypothetical protein